MISDDSFGNRAAAVLGGRGWVARWAEATGVHRTTVSRWARGELVLPPAAEAQLEALEALAAAGLPLPPRWRAGRRRAA